MPEQITYLLQMLKVFQISADSKPSIFHIMFSYPSEKGQQSVRQSLHKQHRVDAAIVLWIIGHLGIFTW